MRPNEQRNKDAVYDHYGRACRCCGATHDLTLDHTNGDGQEHRAQLHGHHTDSHAIYRWIIRHGFPPIFQPLCRPCNRSKGKGSACRMHSVTTRANAELVA